VTRHAASPGQLDDLLRDVLLLLLLLLVVAAVYAYIL